eukprot:UN05922
MIKTMRFFTFKSNKACIFFYAYNCAYILRSKTCVFFLLGTSNVNSITLKFVKDTYK